MHLEGVLPANECLVTLLSAGQCSPFERFRLQHDQMVNKYPVKNNICNKAEVSRVNHNTV